MLDITYDTFLRTRGFTQYLTNFKERGFGIWFANGTVQPYKKNTMKIDTKKFKAHVTDDKFFAASHHFPSQTRRRSIIRKNPISSLSLPRTYPPASVE